MNLLIVDDEISSIRAVSHMLDWETIGIDRCFTALSAAEARRCMEENQIDLLLCDIEMPQQSGLELLEWVNEQQLQISCIYMTCYAEFSYAQKAIQLGSEAYLLKPIDPEELKSVLTAAIQKRQALQAAQSASRLMEEDQDNLCHQFWQELFYEDIPSNRPAIAARIGQLGLPLDPAWYYCTCLVVVRNWGKDMETTHRLNRYAVHNVVAELFEGAAGAASSFFTVFPFGQHGQMCICGGEDGSALFRCCRSFAEQYLASERKYLEVRSVCYLGQPTHIEDAAEEMECLMRMDNSHLKNNGISVHGKAEPALPVESDLEERFPRWSGLLEDGQLEKARTEIVAYLSSQENNVWFNKKRFRQFNSRYSGLLTAYAEKHHFPLNQLTADPQNAHCFEMSDRGLDNMAAWVERSLSLLEQQAATSDDPVQATQQFIEEHLSEKLDMIQIAENVHLNQDYLTRIFKRATGTSIKGYIVNRRMEQAKLLLETSHLPIADVAYRVGYYNYTSFNRIFKKTYGVSPQSCRRGTVSPSC